MMSIERSGSPSSPKVTAGAESSPSKGKVKSGEDSDGAVEVGFLALLTSLAPEAVAADSGGGAQESDELALAQAPSTPNPALETDSADSVAMLLAQAGELAGDAGGSNAPPNAKSAVRSVSQQPISLTAADGVDVAVDVLDPSKAAMTGKAAFDAAALLDRAKNALAARPTSSVGTGQLQSAAAATAAESRGANLTSMLHNLASTPTLASAVAASGWNEGLIRSPDRPGAKLAGFQSGLGVEGAGGGHLFQAGNRSDLPSAMVNPSMPTFQSAVAERLNYWIAQGVQNAELEIDGFGDEPVAVRISLKGDEAHIGFRTDQPEIRRLLEGASAQLKDILASEGLLLSQVSVGTSGQPGSDQQERRPPGGVRTGIIKSTEAANAEVARRPGSPIGNALDLFV